jgi:steroid delta-isomerase
MIISNGVEHMSGHATALRSYFDRMNARDLEGIVALFAQDAVCEDPVGDPSRRHVGHAALRQKYADVITRARFEIQGDVCSTSINFAAASVHAFTGGKRIEVISVAEFDEEGRIKHYRVFFGPENIHDV